MYLNLFSSLPIYFRNHFIRRRRLWFCLYAMPFVAYSI